MRLSSSGPGPRFLKKNHGLFTRAFCKFRFRAPHRHDPTRKTLGSNPGRSANPGARLHGRAPSHGPDAVGSALTVASDSSAVLSLGRATYFRRDHTRHLVSERSLEQATHANQHRGFDSRRTRRLMRSSSYGKTGLFTRAFCKFRFRVPHRPEPTRNGDVLR